MKKGSGKKRIEDQKYDYNTPHEIMLRQEIDRLEKFLEEYRFAGCNPEETIRRITAGQFDEAIVKRFNELVKAQKIEFSHIINEGNWVLVGADYSYRLRPTPRYRPFTAVEAAAHLREKISLKVSERTSRETADWLLSPIGIIIDGEEINLQDAVGGVIFTDTGEPFGVKEE